MLLVMVLVDHAGMIRIVTPHHGVHGHETLPDRFER